MPSIQTILTAAAGLLSIILVALLATCSAFWIVDGLM